MRALFLSFVLSVSVLTGALAPVNKAHAVIGIATGPVVLTIGGIVTGVSALGVGIGVADGDWGGLTVAAISFVVGIFGVVLLEDDGSINFSAISNEQANKLGITPEEQIAFNAELDEVNAIKDEIQAELSEMENPKIEDSSALWSEYQDSLSVEAYSALAKVAQNCIKVAK